MLYLLAQSLELCCWSQNCVFHFFFFFGMDLESIRQKVLWHTNDISQHDPVQMLQIIWEPVLFQKLIQLYSAVEKPKPSETLKPLPSMGLADESRGKFNTKRCSFCHSYFSATDRSNWERAIVAIIQSQNCFTGKDL